IRTAEPLPVDSYADSRRTGSFILIDPSDGTTLTAGMVGESFAAPEPADNAPDNHGWDF
ncbi:elongation factor 1-alpha C-terminal domain-related protein, partial [Streptomyces sp. NRRL S-813]|uniref:elongation factor 1-alpha C-terminal domain-related protein n=1 Tax=Streptomyces sp. NRRL S-813 TaxID=1463919 RepID=UPI003B63358F